MSRSPDAGRSAIEFDPRHPGLVFRPEHDEADDRDGEEAA